MKHTKGPWTVNKKVNTSVEQEIAGQGMVLICQCEDPDGARTNSEDAANARLIAAAPELLEALKDACIQIEELTDSKIFTASYHELITKATQP